jgi:hypothetical protein
VQQNTRPSLLVCPPFLMMLWVWGIGRAETATMPLCIPQIPRGIPWNWTQRALVVIARRKKGLSYETEQTLLYFKCQQSLSKEIYSLPHIDSLLQMDQILSHINALTAYLPNSMEFISSWGEPKAAYLLKNFNNILWNPKVHYRVHKSPPTVPIPS